MSRKFSTPIGLVALSADPVSGSAGDVYFNTTVNKLKIYNGTAWTEVSGSGGGGGYTASSSAPVSPQQGDTWLNTTSGIEYVYVNDGNSSQWIEFNDAGFAGPGVPTGGTTGQYLVKSSNADYATQWSSLSLPSGIVTTSDTGTVTSTMIANGTIVDADINATAAIAASKISGTAVTRTDTGTVTSTMISSGAVDDLSMHPFILAGV